MSHIEVTSPETLHTVMRERLTETAAEAADAALTRDRTAVAAADTEQTVAALRGLDLPTSEVAVFARLAAAETAHLSAIKDRVWAVERAQTAAQTGLEVAARHVQLQQDGAAGRFYTGGPRLDPPPPAAAAPQDDLGKADVGPGGIFLGDFRAGAVTWMGDGPEGGRTLQVDDGQERAEVGFTRAQMHQFRDRLDATMTGSGAYQVPAGRASWETDGDRHVFRLHEIDAETVAVRLTAAQIRALYRQLVADLAAEQEAAATFPGVTGRLADKHHGQHLDNDAQLDVPAGTLSPQQTARSGRAVRLYRNSTYRRIAAYLRGGGAEDEILAIRERVGERPSLEPVSQHVHDIDEAMGVSRLDRAMVLWRGVRDLETIIGRPIGDNIVGTRWREPSYQSTSVLPNVAYMFADTVLLKLLVPAGVGGIQLDSLPTKREHNREAELLLQRGLDHEVVDDLVVDIGPDANGQPWPVRTWVTRVSLP